MTFSHSLLVLPDCILWEESMARQHKENDCSETNFLPDLASLCPNEEGMEKERVFVGLPLFSPLCTACSSQKPALYLQDLYAWAGSCVLYPHCCFGSTTAFINWESHREVAHIDVGHTIPNTEIKHRDTSIQTQKNAECISCVVTIQGGWLESCNATPDGVLLAGRCGLSQNSNREQLGFLIRLKWELLYATYNSPPVGDTYNYPPENWCWWPPPNSATWARFP